MRETKNPERLLCCLLVSLPVPCAAEFSHDGDIAIRFDDVSERSSRRQYRLRYKPQYGFDNGWSLHGFVATGDDFGSAYNTISDDDDEIHLRRLFARFANEGNKLEFGVIPPYKGRVSSTGLSKEGWIRGVRVVRGMGSGAFEIVVGDLDDLSASKAFGSTFDLSYFEFEYSAQLDPSWSFEIGGEQILDDRFLRGELRFVTGNEFTLAAEVIHNASAGDVKVVLSNFKELPGPAAGIEWFTYYAYTGSDFGPRAELSEDFLVVGHALATKFEGAFTGSERIGWFAEFEFYEGQSRIKLGIQVSLN